MADTADAARSSGQPRGSVDLNTLIPPGGATKFTISSQELPEDAQHRRASEIRNWWLAVVLTSVIIGFGIAYSFLAPTDDLKKLGLGIVSSTFTALLGFLVGQASKR
jgi:hypothetical protein